MDEVTSTHTDPPSRASRTMTAMMMMMVMAIMMMEGSSAWGFPGQCFAGYVHCLRYTSPSFQLKRLLVGSTLKAVSVCNKMIFSATLNPSLGKGGAIELDDFLEKCQRRGGGSFSIQRFIL